MKRAKCEYWFWDQIHDFRYRNALEKTAAKLGYDFISEMIHDLYNSGLSVVNVAETIGGCCDRDTVSKLMRKAGMPTRNEPTSNTGFMFLSAGIVRRKRKKPDGGYNITEREQFRVKNAGGKVILNSQCLETAMTKWKELHGGGGGR